MEPGRPVELLVVGRIRAQGDAAEGAFTPRRLRADAGAANGDETVDRKLAGDGGRSTGGEG